MAIFIYLFWINHLNRFRRVCVCVFGGRRVSAVQLLNLFFFGGIWERNETKEEKQVKLK